MENSTDCKDFQLQCYTNLTSPQCRVTGSPCFLAISKAGKYVCLYQQKKNIESTRVHKSTIKAIQK